MGCGHILKVLAFGLCFVLCLRPINAFWTHEQDTSEKESVDDAVGRFVRRDEAIPTEDILKSVRVGDAKLRNKRSNFAYTEVDQNPNEGYGSWSEWSGCSTNCGIGWQFRKRLCYNTKHCRNGDLEEKICEGVNC